MIKIICKSFLISAAFALTATATNNESKNFSFSKNLELFNSLFRELDIYYVDTINTEKLIQTATDEMLSTLDPYTTFIPKTHTNILKKKRRCRHNPANFRTISTASLLIKTLL